MTHNSPSLSGEEYHFFAVRFHMTHNNPSLSEEECQGQGHQVKLFNGSLTLRLRISHGNPSLSGEECL